MGKKRWKYPWGSLIATAISSFCWYRLGFLNATHHISGFDGAMMCLATALATALPATTLIGMWRRTRAIEILAARFADRTKSRAVGEEAAPMTRTHVEEAELVELQVKALMVFQKLDQIFKMVQKTPLLSTETDYARSLARDVSDQVDALTDYVRHSRMIE